jgi:hypothetical protein
MHGSRGVECALTQWAGAGLGALSLLLAPLLSEPSSIRALANDTLAPSLLHHCFAAAYANLGNEAKHKLASLMRFAVGV